VTAASGTMAEGGIEPIETMNRKNVVRHSWPWVALVALLAVIYIPDIGHGFIRDDFGWIVHGQIDDLRDLWRVVASDLGFYRPVPALSFSLSWWLFDLQPVPYGLTNFLLLLLCVGAIFRLGRALELPSLAAFVAAALWSLNFHGINAVVLWPSARPALFLVLGSALAAESFLRGRPVVSAMWYALAVFSKEEAVVLPFVLGATHLLSRRIGPPEARVAFWTSVKPALRATLPLVMVLAFYLVARTYSGAFWAHNASPNYQPTLDPVLLFWHIVQYVREGAVVAAAATLVVALVMRAVPRHVDTVTLSFCTLWFAFGYALTVFAPVPSSLYVCFPSVGAALLAGHLVAAMVPVARQARLAAAGLALFAALLPLYWSHNAPWVALAERSTLLLNDLVDETSRLPPQGTVNLIDDRLSRLRATFGSLAPAGELFLGDQIEVRVNAHTQADLTLRLVNGRFRRQ
jgi:hypothetical protein